MSVTTGGPFRAPAPMPTTAPIAPPLAPPPPPAESVGRPSAELIAARVAAAARTSTAKKPRAARPRRQVTGPLRWLGCWLTGTRPPRPQGAPEPSPEAMLVATSLKILAALLLGFLMHLTVLGTLAHNRAQQVAYDDLRLSLAEGTTPIGPAEGVAAEGVAAERQPQPLGTPIARLEIPAIGVKEVVLEGTTSGVLRSGVGHRRDTVYPGQAGTSVLMGRRMAYGGPFSKLGDLAVGDEMRMVTGQGEVSFRVVAVRTAGDAQLQPSFARLTLITTAGSRFSPGGLRYVDADLVGTAFDAATPFYSVTTLPKAELPLEGNPGALDAVAGWGILLVGTAVGTTWLRLRWGRWQAWLIAVPTLGFFGVSTADKVAELLPNLL